MQFYSAAIEMGQQRSERTHLQLYRMDLDAESEIESASEYYQVPFPQRLIKKTQLQKIDFDCLNACHGTTLNPLRVTTFEKVVMTHQEAMRTILEHLQQETDFLVLSQQTGLSLTTIIKEMERLFATRLSSLHKIGKDRNILIIRDIPAKIIKKAATTIVQLNRILSIKKHYPLIWNYVVNKGRDRLDIMFEKDLREYCRELLGMLAFLKIYKEPRQQMVINLQEQERSEVVIDIEEDKIVSPSNIILKSPSKPSQNVDNEIIYLSQDEQILQDPPQPKHPSHQANIASSQTNLSSLSHLSDLKHPSSNLNMSIVKEAPKRIARSYRFSLHQDRGADFTAFRNLQFPRFTLRNTLSKILNDVVFAGAETMRQSCLKNNVDYESLMAKLEQIRGRSLSTFILQQFFDSLTLLEKKVLFEQFVIKAVQDYPRYVNHRGKMNPTSKQSHIQTARQIAKIILQYYKAQISSQLPQRIIKLQFQLEAQDKNTKEGQSYQGNHKQSTQLKAEPIYAAQENEPHLILEDI